MAPHVAADSRSENAKPNPRAHTYVPVSVSLRKVAGARFEPHHIMRMAFWLRLERAA